MLSAKDTIQSTYDAFRWDIPEFYNIGVDVCDRWAECEPDRLAIIDVAPTGAAKEHSFDDLRRASNRLANALAHFVSQGDRVGVLLPQCFETAASHVAIYKIGAIAQPLFTLFGPDALLYRLKDSGASTVITTLLFLWPARSPLQVCPISHQNSEMAAQLFSSKTPTILGFQIIPVD